MEKYRATFEHQRLPLGMSFTNDAIVFMKEHDEFVQYYHNYYKKDIIFDSFRQMVDQRVHSGEIVRLEGLNKISLIKRIYNNYDLSIFLP